MAEDHKSTILVVEDESELRFVLSAHLRACGFQVFEAVDGEQAVKLATQHVPDLVVMDIGLPGTTDGVAATKKLKSSEQTRQIPVIMLTARSSADDVVRGLEAGAQEYLSKPFEMNEFIARVQTVHRLAVAHQRLDRLNSELEAEVGLKTKRLQILYDFMRDLHQTNDRDSILDLIVAAVESLTGAHRISLLLADETGENLSCERAIGIDPNIAQTIRVQPVQGIAGQVFHSGKALSARTYGGTEASDRGYDRDAFLSTPLVSTSLQSEDGIIGVLNITEKPDDQQFTEEEIECVRSIADAAAIALDNIRRRVRLQESVKVLLRTLGHLAEFRDEETTRHLERVSLMARILTTELSRSGPYAPEVGDAFIEMLVQAAPMHDIGKVGIPDEILTKPGKLTPEEFRVMKTHADIGRRVLSKAVDPANPVPLLQMCIDIAHSHHERYDGKGYPRGIHGTDIPLAARIIAVVDAYDAISSERRYSKARPHSQAVNIVRSEAGKHFDPHIVEAFLRCHHQFLKISQAFRDTPRPLEAVLG